MEHKYKGGRVRPENTKMGSVMRGYCQTCGRPKSGHFPQAKGRIA